MLVKDEENNHKLKSTSILLEDDKHKKRTKIETTAVITSISEKPATCSFVELFECNRARSGRFKLKHGFVDTPIFMPVGTHGVMKGVTTQMLEEIGYKIILANSYHVFNRPGSFTLEVSKGLHNFMGWKRNLLTDSGGFQMVSLQRLSKVSEKGVLFRSPIDEELLLLTPEKSIEIQNIIGSDIIMALDDVVPATLTDRNRVEEATDRTTRWIDRCINAHKRCTDQCLFGIVQGGLFRDLRLRSLKDMSSRDLPGYAIGGLSGGEEKDDFWRVVELCTRPNEGLPHKKPRYLMGVGYPLDIVVCIALGVDMFDCVYPTRTARFGTALVPEGVLKLKLKKFANDLRPIQKDCLCEACATYSRSFLHVAVTKETSLTRLITHHNLTYMYKLCENIQIAIKSNAYPDFVLDFLRSQFASGLKDNTQNGSNSNTDETASCPPIWVKDALKQANIDIENMYDWSLVKK